MFTLKNITKVGLFKLYMVSDIGFEYSSPQSALLILEVTSVTSDSHLISIKLYYNKKSFTLSETFWIYYMVDGGRYRIRTYDPLRIKQMI